MDDPKTLVSTDWLAAHLKDPHLRILDASWYMPADGRDARAEYQAAHIPRARFFDIDATSDPSSNLPHMAPTSDRFAAAAGGLGIGDADQVVVYDGAGLFSAARVWWLFRLMGKTDVAVLDGGLPKWKAEHRPVEKGSSISRPAHLGARLQPELVMDVTQVAQASKLSTHVIVDARAPERFRGEVKEPRPGLRSGHIPGARNVFFRELLRGDGTMKPPAMLREVFESAGVDLSRPAITSCGSGVTAAILNLAFERIGKTDHALYDGSWTEWGGYDDLKLERGE
jgi:thiosulfate/3-mercaptopyruvate sulfurtransferase